MASEDEKKKKPAAEDRALLSCTNIRLFRLIRLKQALL